MFRLKPKQNLAYNLILEGKNIFLSGPAGVGKSEVIKLFVKIYSSSKDIALTSMTGTSALLINGTTLHSYLGIGLGTGSVTVISTKILEKKYLKRRWNKLDTLIIDEISMMSPELFDKLEEVARIVRKNEKPFGGIQLVLSGDLLQLPCINSNEFCVHAKSWNDCIDSVICLTDIIRQDDPIFQEFLNHIRVAEITNRDIEILESRVNAEIINDFGIKPTKLYALNRDVDYINEEEMDKLATNDTEFFEYNMDINIYRDSARQDLLEKIKKYCIAPEVLQLCVGAQVMLLYNLDLESKLANGSRGIVVRFCNELPVVKFLNGIERVIDYNIWEIEEMDIKIMSLSQIPLKPAYAISIHKCCSADTMIYTENGLQKISKISSDFIVNHQPLTTEKISINVMGKTGYEEVTQIYKGEIEETIKITTSLGYSIEGSYRHPILVYDGEEEWKKLPEIQVGEYIVLKKNTKCFGGNISTHTFLENCKNHYIAPMFVESELCYLIGVLLCNSVKTDYSIEFYIYKDCNDVKDRIFSIFENIFGVNCIIYDNYSNLTYKLVINSNYIKSFLEWCGIDYDTKTIPWVVLENTYESQVECLKGLYDIDGGVDKNCVYYRTVSYNLAKDIQNILLNIGIISSLKKLDKRLVKKYTIYITGYYAHIFYNLIGFVNPIKQFKLKCLYQASNIICIPNGNKMIKQFRNSNKMNKKYSNISSNSKKLISRIIKKQKFTIEQLEYLCKNINNIEMFGEVGKKLAYLYNNNLFFDRVVKIEKSKSQLYDLYVPSDHTFIGNGIINHNSQGCTLDCVELDLSNIFEYGHAYTALSRVRSLNGLSIINYDIQKIRAHPKALEFYNNILSS